MVSSKPKLRSFGDRLRQIALFEIGGLLLITPPFAWASGVPIAESIGLLAVLDRVENRHALYLLFVRFACAAPV